MDPVPSNPRRPIFVPGTLRDALERVRAEAERVGALLAIPTVEQRVRVGEVELIVRVVVNLGRKDVERRRQAGQGDPTASTRDPAALPEAPAVTPSCLTKRRSTWPMCRTPTWRC